MEVASVGGGVGVNGVIIFTLGEFFLDVVLIIVLKRFGIQS